MLSQEGYDLVFPIVERCFRYAELSSHILLQLFIFEHLDDFQRFDFVPVYYDGGHETVSRAPYSAFAYALAREAVIYRDLSYQDKLLAQAADYLCSVELAAMRYPLGGESGTYRRFWGKPRSFKQNYLKQARRKALR